MPIGWSSWTNLNDLPDFLLPAGQVSLEILFQLHPDLLRRGRLQIGLLQDGSDLVLELFAAQLGHGEANFVRTNVPTDSSSVVAGAAQSRFKRLPTISNSGLWRARTPIKVCFQLQRKEMALRYETSERGQASNAGFHRLPIYNSWSDGETAEVENNTCWSFSWRWAY